MLGNLRLTTAVGWVSLGALVSALSAPTGTNFTPHGDNRNGRIPIWKRSSQEVITRLNLTANPEKGYFFETFRDAGVVNNNRSASTAIYYLLEGSAGSSLWHRIDTVEVWHYYAGSPLVLSLSHDDGQPTRQEVLGPDVFDGQRPQVIVSGWEWQSATSLGDWTLVGTTGTFGLEFKSPACRHSPF